MSNDLGKIYEERIPVVKPKNIVKEQEVICEDITAILNNIRDNKKIRSSEIYNSNSNAAGKDDIAGKKKLALLSGISKQDYNTSAGTASVGAGASNYNTTTGNNANFESNDAKTKNDFNKFMINKKDTVSSSKLQSLKTNSSDDPAKNIRDQIRMQVREKMKTQMENKGEENKLKMNDLKK